MRSSSSFYWFTLLELESLSLSFLSLAMEWPLMVWLNLSRTW